MQRGSVIQKANTIYAVYRLPSKKQVWVNCGTGAKGRRTAKHHLAITLGDIAKQGHSYREPRNAFFDEFTEEFLTANAYRYKASTLVNYRSLIRSRLIPHFGHSAMRKSVTVEGVTSFTNSLLAAGTSTITTNHILTILSAVCSWAVLVDVLPRNPVHQVVRPKTKGNEVFVREVLSPSQIHQVVQATPKGWKRNLVVIAAHTAMRAGEIAALKSSSVDWNTSELLVEATAVRRKVQNSTKTSTSRRIPMSAAVQAAVRDQLCNRPPNRQDLLFCGASGAVLDMSVVGQEVLQPALKRVGIALPANQASWMVFRHSTISYWCASGMPPANVASLAGHNLATTMKNYIHAIPAANQQAAVLMDALSNPTSPAAAKTA